MVSETKAALTRLHTRSWERRADRRDDPGLRVLLYHRVNASGDALATHPDDFRRQMEHLAAEGYRGLDLVSALDALYEGRLEPGSVALTFDDGFRDVKDHALGVLEELGFSATVFVTTGVSDGALLYPWAPGDPILHWDDIRQLDGQGVLRFEPHSITHLHLTRLDDEDCAREIVGSKLVFEHRIGREARAFCYPNGLAGPRERELVCAAGFRYAVTCEPGLNTPAADPFLIRRVQIDQTDRICDFDAKIRGGYDRELMGLRTYRRLRFGSDVRRAEAGAKAVVLPASVRDAHEDIARKDVPGEIVVAEPCDLVVSLVNHNAAERTLACLASIFEDGSRRCSLEVVVLDNDSDVPVAPAIEAAFPDVKVITQSFRDGFGANHNRVIRATKSRHVLVLNNDTSLPPGTLDALVAYLDDHPIVGIVGPSVRFADGVRQPAAFGFPTPLASFLFAATFGQVGMIQSKSGPESGEAPKRVDWISGAAMAVRRSALDRVGIFDEGFFMYHEDTDLCRRLGDAGYEAHTVPTIEIVHDHWGATNERFRERIDEAHRSRRRYWAKHHGRLGSALAPYADAVRYTTAAWVASAVERLPEQLRPAMAREWNAEAYRYNAKSALRRTPGRGMRELARAHNVARPEAEPALVRRAS